MISGRDTIVIIVVIILAIIFAVLYCIFASRHIAEPRTPTSRTITATPTPPISPPPDSHDADHNPVRDRPEQGQDPIRERPIPEQRPVRVRQEHGRHGPVRVRE